MIEQMGAATGAGEVNKVDKGWPPKSMNQKMLKQQGEDRGNIDALMSGGHYDPSTVTGASEGMDVTPNESTPYGGGENAHVAGGTYGFTGVPAVGTKVEPYPEIESLIYKGEPIGAGYQPRNMVPVTETPGNSKVVGDMGTGMPRDGEFSGPAKIGPGNMVSDFEASEARDSGAEDTFTAPLVGDLFAGMPWDGSSTEKHMASQLSPEGLVTGNEKGAYAPGVNKPTVVPPVGTRPSNDRGIAGSADIKAGE